MGGKQIQIHQNIIFRFSFQIPNFILIFPLTFLGGPGKVLSHVKKKTNFLLIFNINNFFFFILLKSKTKFLLFSMCCTGLYISLSLSYLLPLTSLSTSHCWCNFLAGEYFIFYNISTSDVTPSTWTGTLSVESF